MTTYTIHDRKGLHGPFQSLNAIGDEMAERYHPGYDPKVLACDNGENTRMLNEQEFETVVRRLIGIAANREPQYDDAYSDVFFEVFG